MIDLVVSHTSDKHPWFVESRSSRSNAKADWYVWADSEARRHTAEQLAVDLRRLGLAVGSHAAAILPAQLPDVSARPQLPQSGGPGRHPRSARFWLERGVDGFRLDTINFYFHDRELRDNPALPPELRNDTTAPAVNPYNYQDHIFDKSRPENIAFLKRFRALMDEFPAIAAVGEVGDSQRGLEIVAEYTSGGDKMHMCYAFEFLANEPLSAERVARVITDFQTAAPEGWACWAFSNHDVVRHASRWQKAAGGRDDDHYLRLLSGVLLSLRGSACLYQGEELGLTEADIAFEDLQDPYGIQFWPDFKGRDGCRTPMVWESDKPNGGFSVGQPWLPVPPEHRHHAVDAQDHVNASMLNHYRHLLAFRRQHAALAKGDMVILSTAGNVLQFTRSLGNETLFCAFNFTAETQSFEAPDPSLTTLEGHGFSGLLREGRIELPPFEGFFGRLD
jgi:alpha-glucosidase